MSSTNFNTATMKVAFFEVDEDDRELLELGSKSLKKLLDGLTYADERAKAVDINVRMCVTLNPNVSITDDQADVVMKHLKEMGVNVIYTEPNLVIGMNDSGYKLSLKVTGGTGAFVKSTLASRDRDSTGSYVDMTGGGLTQDSIW